MINDRIDDTLLNLCILLETLQSEPETASDPYFEILSGCDSCLHFSGQKENKIKMFKPNPGSLQSINVDKVLMADKVGVKSVKITRETLFVFHISAAAVRSVSCEQTRELQHVLTL